MTHEEAEQLQWEYPEYGLEDGKAILKEHHEEILNKVYGDFKQEILKYRHYYNTTVGMFATDRPDLVDDSMYRVLFELLDDDIDG